MTAQGPAIRRSMIPASWLFATCASVLTAIPMLSAQATFRGSNDSQATATQALVEAARSGDLPAIASLIEAGANVNGTAPAMTRHYRRARWTIARGAIAPTSLVLGGHAAAQEGHTSVVRTRCSTAARASTTLRKVKAPR